MKVVFSKPLRLPTVQKFSEGGFCSNRFGNESVPLLLPLSIVPGTQQEPVKYGGSR